MVCSKYKKNDKMFEYNTESLKNPFWISRDEKTYIQLFCNSDPAISEQDLSPITMYWIHPYNITLHDGVEPKRAWYCDEKRTLTILKNLKMVPTKLKLFLTGGSWYEP